MLLRRLFSSGSGSIRSVMRPPPRPLVAVIGATGTGKSQLAVEIARRYNGEIINGDAMQLYQGLPIITNKIKEDEMMGVPHHLLGCIGLHEETWTVSKFVEQASRIIEDIHQRGRLPVLVGGTHYYTQSLLFGDSLPEEDSSGEENPNSSTKASIASMEIHSQPTDVLLAKLRQVDPVMADRWHPNERRKILRSLEIYLKTGKPASQVYQEQAQRKKSQQPVANTQSNDDEAENMDEDTGLPNTRYPTLLFWVHSSPDILRNRLDSRVDKMLQEGLLDEVRSLDDFLSAEAAAGKPVDRTRGIWVSIGYKEFEAYQNALKESSSTTEIALADLRNAAIEKVKSATRQYAKRQVRWIRIKLLHALEQASATDQLFLLDGSDLAQWDAAVQQPALDLTGSFLAGETLPKPTSISPTAQEMLVPKREYDLSQRQDLWVRRTCDVCKLVAVTENEWNLHIKSRGHRRAVKAREKRKNGERIKAQRQQQRQQQQQQHQEEASPVSDLDDTMDLFDDTKADDK